MPRHRAECCLLKEPPVLDIVFVLGLVAVFVLISLVAKGVEKL